MFQDVASKNNTRLKFARKVRSGKIDEFVFAEGMRLVEELLRSQAELPKAYVSETFSQKHRDLVDRLLSQNIDVFRLSDKVFESIADTRSTQGVVLICKKPKTGAEIVAEKLIGRSSLVPLVVYLHRINNPSNLGAIFRTAEAAGISGIIVSEHSANVFSPKALRGSMGACMRIPVWENADFNDVLNWSRRMGLISTCADINSKTSYLDIDWKKGRLMIFGSEADGLTQEEFSRIEENLRIPMENGVESLNLAVSSALVMYEFKRRNDQ
ncbi:MAG: RNA methyltransferase [Pyrinomonadaceae bacterium]